MLRILMASTAFIAISLANSYTHPGDADGRLLPVQVFDRTTISAGRGTDTVYLGQTKEEIIEVLGKPLNTMTGGHRNPRSCYETSLQWYETKELGSLGEGNGIYAYLVNNRVVELYFSSKLYRTTGGVAYGLSSMNGATETSAFPIQGLTRSSSEATNGNDERYIVNEDAGIAFQIDPGDLVYGIYVFEAHSQFQPWGCLGREQNFYLK